MEIKYTKDHIPKNTPCNRRPGIYNQPTTLTIHNTGNPTSTARNERGWLTNPSNPRQASFHIVVDQNEAIEVLPLDEVAWHAGDGNRDGNRRSIGIEICESGNYGQTLQNAAELVASMLKKRGWGIDRLRRHFDWSGKICPHLMYSGGKWTAWERFLHMVRSELSKLQQPEATVEMNGKAICNGIFMNNLVSVPIRKLATALGATVSWNGTHAIVNGKTIIGSQVISGSAHAPVREVVEAAGGKVTGWDGKQRKVSICK